MRFLTVSTLIAHFALSNRAFADNSESYVPCLLDNAKQQARSSELKRLYEEDQADRSNNQMKPGADMRDRNRRERVGQIFGEGCFKSGDDFANAAMIYQHGGDLHSTEPGVIRGLAAEQLFQAFLWAKRATELGTESKWLTAAAIDRYLQYSGRKQLFGTQTFKFKINDPCWCLVPTESTFPDSMRVQYTGKTLIQALEHLKDFPGQQKDCKPTYCSLNLQPSPSGTAPGFW